MFCTKYLFTNDCTVCGVDITNNLRVFDVVQKVFYCMKKNAINTHIWLYIAAQLSAVLVFTRRLETIILYE